MCVDAMGPYIWARIDGKYHLPLLDTGADYFYLFSSQMKCLPTSERPSKPHDTIGIG